MKKAKSFDTIILLLTIISLIIVFLLTFEIYFFPIFKSSISNNINDFLNDLSIGIICSSIFYFIVQWYPNYIKYNIAKNTNEDYIKLIKESLERILFTYSKNFNPNNYNEKFVKKELNEITNLGVIKIEHMDEIDFLNYELENIHNNSIIVLQSTYIDYLLSDTFKELSHISQKKPKIFEKIRGLRMIKNSPFLRDNIKIITKQNPFDYKELGQDLIELYSLYISINKY